MRAREYQLVNYWRSRRRWQLPNLSCSFEFVSLSMLIFPQQQLIVAALRTG